MELLVWYTVTQTLFFPYYLSHTGKLCRCRRALSVSLCPKVPDCITSCASPTALPVGQQTETWMIRHMTHQQTYILLEMLVFDSLAARTVCSFLQFGNANHGGMNWDAGNAKVVRTFGTCLSEAGILAYCAL